jgi:cysteine desulfurase
VSPDAPIYLDYNATTPVLRQVLDAMLPYLREHFGNPSSGHSFGQYARAAVEKAREQVAVSLGCEPDEIFFTSGGTEANNLAIRGVSAAGAERRQIITTTIEHPATERPCAELATKGWPVTRCGVDGGGRVRIDDVRQALETPTALLTVMHANNETGIIQPIADLAALAHSAGALVHTDAAQSVGKIPLSVRDLDVDLLSVAGHKLYAPKGVGALYVRRSTPIAPLILGAGHERGLRPGTENVASIVGLGVACEIAVRDLETVGARVSGLRDQLWRELAAAIPGLAQNGDPGFRLPNTLNVRFPKVSGSALLAAASGEVAASTGSACHEARDSASPIILAMGVAPAGAVGSVRLSLGRETRKHDVERAAAALERSWREVRSLRPANP